MSEGEHVEEIARRLAHDYFANAHWFGAELALIEPMKTALLAYGDRVRAEALELEAALLDGKDALRDAEVGLLSHSELTVPVDVIAKWLRHIGTALASQPEETSGASAAQPPSGAVAPSQAREK